MNAEFTGYIVALAEQQHAVTLTLDKLSRQVDDDVLLRRLTMAFQASDNLRGIFGIISDWSRMILSEEERQKDLILKQYQASIDAREVTK